MESVSVPIHRQARLSLGKEYLPFNFSLSNFLRQILDFGFWIMNEREFQSITKHLGLRIIIFIATLEALPNKLTTQINRSGY